MEKKHKTVSLNFVKEKHCDLLQWIYEEADDREMSVSAFCISILKEKWRVEEEEDE